MRILLTGATGSVGREVVKLLVAGGHEVRVLGRRAELVLPGAEYQACDITDFTSLKEHMRGTDGVIHLAALATPLHGPDEEVFRINCDGSFNVYQAAAELGIRRVVSASSINAFGYHYGIRSFPIRYLPIDEEHPTFTTDSYSFSKQILEEIAAYFWRREGISGCCLRLPWVVNPTPEVLAQVRGDLAVSLPILREWIRLPPAQGAARAGEVFASKERSRSARMEEYPADYALVGTLSHAAIMGSYTNFFTQLDARDSAQAFAKALFASYEGSHPLFVNDSVNRYLLDSRELARLFFPEAEARPGLRGSASLVSIESARRLIGYEPEHTIDRLAVHPGR
jgi:NAD(P)-dependent dehydrogenase (short-subunit alcohol dehydrogenase family)